MKKPKQLFIKSKLSNLSPIQSKNQINYKNIFN